MPEGVEEWVLFGQASGALSEVERFPGRGASRRHRRHVERAAQFGISAAGAETLRDAYHGRPAEQPRPGTEVIGPIMSARAQTFTLSGDTTGAPTFQRPVEDLSALSMIGTAAHYALYSFNAAVSGL